MINTNMHTPHKIREAATTMIPKVRAKSPITAQQLLCDGRATIRDLFTFGARLLNSAVEYIFAPSVHVHHTTLPAQTFSRTKYT